MTRRERRLGLLLLLAASSTVVSCQKFEDWLFQRNSPTVDRAIRALETRDAGDAHALLSEYLSTGRCKDGIIGTPDLVRERPNASVDLGLTLFQLAERYGEKFGEPPPASEEERASQSPQLARRSQEVDCAQRVVRIIAQDERLPLELRAQAYYLSGNLDFLRHDYASAVKSYDAALELIPGGVADAGEGVGNRAAYNRAIALVRAEQQEKEQEPPPKSDAGTPPPGDAGSGDEGEKPDDSAQQSDDQQEKDQENQENQDQENPDEPNPEQPPQDPPKSDDGQSGSQQRDDTQASASSSPAASAAPLGSAPTGQRPPLSQDEQILQMLERAPMIQQELPKARGRVMGRSGMEDK